MATIREMDSGNWQAVIRRRGIKPVFQTFGTKTDAARWARHVESEIDRGAFLDRTEAERTTMAALIDRYLAEVTPGKKSERRERQRMGALRAKFGLYSVASLRSTHIAGYRDARLSAGIAGATVVKELNSLSHLLDVAIKDWGLGLTVNVAKLVRRPQVARGRERRLSHEEETRLCGRHRQAHRSHQRCHHHLARPRHGPSSTCWNTPPYPRTSIQSGMSLAPFSPKRLTRSRRRQRAGSGENAEHRHE